MRYEHGTCPRCGQTAALSQTDGRTVLAHSVRWQHLDGCPYVGTVSGFCQHCKFEVYKDGRGCKGAGRVAVEKRGKRGKR
jgi:hypothetical protein